MPCGFSVGSVPDFVFLLKFVSSLHLRYTMQSAANHHCFPQAVHVGATPPIMKTSFSEESLPNEAMGFSTSYLLTKH
jgi:hypothetical protein